MAENDLEWMSAEGSGSGSGWTSGTISNDCEALQFLFPCEPDSTEDEDSSIISLTTEDFTRTESIPTYCLSPAILLIFPAIAIVASFSVFVDAAIRRRRKRGVQYYFHIFLSSLLMFLPFAFSISSRFAGVWTFGDACFKALALISCAAYTTCSWHLIYFVIARCAEFQRGRKVLDARLRKIISCVIWLVAVLFAVPCAVEDGILSDVIKGEPIQQSRSSAASAFKIVNFLVNFLFPCLTITLCLLITIHHAKRGMGTMRWKKLRDIEEPAIISLVFLVCWLPYRIWKMMSLNFDSVSGCGIIQDSFLCVGITFSIILPILHRALGLKRRGSLSPDNLDQNNNQLVAFCCKIINSRN